MSAQADLYAERQAVATARNYKKEGTSAEAAAATEPKSAYWRQKVREALAIKPMAPHDIAKLYNVDVTSIRPRCSELLNGLGHIERCGRAQTPAGRFADIYRLTSTGRELVRAHPTDGGGP